MLVKKFQKLLRFPSQVLARLDLIQQSLGRIETSLMLAQKDSDPRDAEFRVYSQWGEDGIIQYLVDALRPKNRFFVEFGVENYQQANSRFLLVNNNWRGLVIDGSQDNINFIRNDDVSWAHDLKFCCSFLTKENINSVIQNNIVNEKVDLLSVDIDGNDYWVWESIDCVDPLIVICEYNSIFGPSADVSTPYQSDFVRNNFHSSNIVYGASISALYRLASEKGYSLVAGNSAGNNLFFVKTDHLGHLNALRPEQAYVKATFREHKSEDGRLTHFSFGERLNDVADVSVFDFKKGAICLLRDVEGLSDEYL